MSYSVWQAKFMLLSELYTCLKSTQVCDFSYATKVLRSANSSVFRVRQGYFKKTSLHEDSFSYRHIDNIQMSTILATESSQSQFFVEYVSIDCLF